MSHLIHQGDVVAVLRDQPAGAFDACFCDPPYGLSFMGKAWDHGVPGAETWAEVLRVLKPGAPLMAFGGTRTFHRLACAIEDGGFILSDTLCWLHGQGFPKGHAQLKPAWEPITLAWKKGPRVLAIDTCRIGTAEKLSYSKSLAKNATWGKSGTGEQHALGRWPANVILDEEAAQAVDAHGGISKSTGNGAAFDGKSFFGGGSSQVKAGRYGLGLGDSGGASRFFYCAKASRKERNAGLEGLAAKFTPTMGKQNTHPTVKPQKLCEYFARLILPAERDTPRRLLVPFSGSGSEMLGALAAGWDEVVGVELSPEYVDIARRRLDARSGVESEQGDLLKELV